MHQKANTNVFHYAVDRKLKDKVFNRGKQLCRKIKMIHL